MGPNPRNRKNRRHLSSRDTARAARAANSAALFEPLENRLLLSLLGITTLGYPKVSYNSTGVINYAPTTDAFDLTATPIGFLLNATSGPGRILVTTPPAHLALHLQVDNTGRLIGGVPGDDFTVTGSIDTNHDGLADYSGTLLTGEVLAFGFGSEVDPTTGTEEYDFRLEPTGGSLLSQFAGQDIGFLCSSEHSNFADFTIPFTGGAKGSFGPIATLPLGRLAGYSYVDANNNGAFDAGETPLAGTTITLNGTDSVGQAVAQQIASTGTDGSYSFANLRPGTYTIQESQPGAYLDGKDTVGTQGGTVGPDQFTNVVLGQGVSGINNNFGELAPASLAGLVYLDQNDNGLFNSGLDLPLSNVNVTLTGVNDLGTIAPQSELTAIDGSYLFTGLRPGSYAITESPAPYNVLDGLANPAGSLGGTVGQDQFTTITAASGNNGVNYNFAWVTPASVSGNVYNDANDNGVFNTGETGISGVLVTLTGIDDLGHAVAPQTHITAAGGGYSFSVLRPGTYTITETTQPAAYLDGKDTVGTQGGTVGQDQFTNVVLGPAAGGLNYNFGELLPASITGTAFLDVNDNGVFDQSTDRMIGGMTITLTGIDDLGNSVAPRQQVTSASGAYTFTNLRPGTYTLTETQPTTAGFIDGRSTVGSIGGASLGPDQVITNPLAAGVNAFDYNFTELPTPAINIVKAGPQIANAGAVLTYSYTVTDGTLTPLSNVSVTDNLAGTAAPVLGSDHLHNVGDMNSDGKLDPGEVWQFTAGYVPNFTPNSDLTNVATAAGTFAGVTATAQASYTLHPFTLAENTFLYYSTSNPANDVPYSLPDSNVYSIQAFNAGNTLVDSFQVSASTTQGLWLSDGIYSFAEAAPPAGYAAAVQFINYNTNGSTGGNVQAMINVPTFDLAVVKSGPTDAVSPGQTVSYSYTLTNSGPAAVTPTIVDDITGTPTFAGGDANGDGLIESGETWLYTSQYTVPTDFTDSSITNTVTVDDAANPHAPAGTLVGGDTNPDNNVSLWTVPTTIFEEPPVIAIVKNGPVFATAGSLLTYTYQVTNPGTNPLSNVSVFDDQASFAHYVSGDADGDGMLEPGETWTFAASTTPTFTANTPLTNTAYATGYFGDQSASAQASYTLHPFTLAENTFLYYSTSNPALDVHYALPDTNVYSVQAFDSSDAVLGSFTVSESTTQGVWLGDGTYTFTEAAPPAGYNAAVQSVTYSTDGSSGGNLQTLINVPTFDLAVVKSGPTAAVRPGQAISYSYTLTNSGPAAVAPTISDNVTGTPTFVSGDTNGDHRIESNETWVYTSQYTVPTNFTGSSITNTVTVDDAANPHAPAGTIVGGDTNPANNVSVWTVPVSVSSVTPVIAISKSGPIFATAGSLLTYTYQVTDPGTTSLSSVTVVDDKAGAARYVSGDANANGKLDPGETWTFSASTTPTFTANTPLVNTATATGSYLGKTATAQASYKLNPFVLNKDLYLYYATSSTSGCGTISYSCGGGSSSGSSSYNVHYSVVDNTPFTVQVTKGSTTVGQVQISESAPANVWLSDGTYTFTEAKTPAGYVPVTGSVTYTTGAGSNSKTMINVVTFDLAVAKTGPATATAGQNITYTYTVTNAGPAAVTPVLSDNLTGKPTYQSGDTNRDGLIESSESWIYTSPYTVPANSSGTGTGGFGGYSNCGNTSYSNYGSGYSTCGGSGYNTYSCGSTHSDCSTGGNSSYTITNTATVDAAQNPHAPSYVHLTGGDTNSANNTSKWTVTVQPPPPPASLAGFVYLDSDKDGAKDCKEQGLAGVTVTLDGKDVLGNIVHLTAKTDSSGAYLFSNLKAGTYTLTETQPAGYLDGKDSLGSLGGTLGSDAFSAIHLTAGAKAVNYNFAELLKSSSCSGGSYGSSYGGSCVGSYHF